jgi:hypothetical protein
MILDFLSSSGSGNKQIGQSPRWLPSGCWNKISSHNSATLFWQTCLCCDLCSLWHWTLQYRTSSSLHVGHFSNLMPSTSTMPQYAQRKSASPSMLFFSPSTVLMIPFFSPWSVVPHSLHLHTKWFRYKLHKLCRWNKWGWGWAGGSGVLLNAIAIAIGTSYWIHHTLIKLTGKKAYVDLLRYCTYLMFLIRPRTYIREVLMCWWSIQLFPVPRLIL